MRRVVTALAALVAIAAAQIDADTGRAAESAAIAVLQGLDKVTARVSTLDAPLDVAVRFGALELVARACYKAPPEEPPESAAFLEIRELAPDAPARSVFSGWMFASSPGLSALEHPVYDVWVLDCRAAEEESAPAAAQP
ncbi:MAG: DUF2155 domain-containing protein [Alphaproteobacteria bacterium]